MKLLNSLQRLSYPLIRALAYRITINESTLESWIQTFFPLETGRPGLSLRLENPKIRLYEPENRIHLFTDLVIQLPGKIVAPGHMEMAGTLIYASAEGAFFIDNPEICQFSVLSIPPRYLKPVQLLLSGILTAYIADTPIYKFQESSIKHRLAKTVFKTVEIHNGSLKVKFAL